MKIILITQDDVFYLGKSINYLLNKMPTWVNFSGIIILRFSPAGKPEQIIKRIIKVYNTFGIRFFLKYLLKYIRIYVFNRQLLIKSIITKYNIKEIKLIDDDINSSNNINLFSHYNPDLIISISANQIFKKQLLNLPKYGCINLHTSLLPDYKGLMPTFWALKNNESKLGVSVFFMNEGIDTGQILSQDIVQIEPHDTLESLIIKTKKVGMDAIINGLIMIKSGEIKTFKVEGEGSYYGFPTKKDVKEFLDAGKLFW